MHKLGVAQYLATALKALEMSGRVRVGGHNSKTTNSIKGQSPGASFLSNLCQQKAEHSCESPSRIHPPLVRRISAGENKNLLLPIPLIQHPEYQRNSPRFWNRTIWFESLQNCSHLSLSLTANISSTCPTIVVTLLPSSIKRKMHAPARTYKKPKVIKHLDKC